MVVSPPCQVPARVAAPAAAGKGGAVPGRRRQATRGPLRNPGAERLGFAGKGRPDRESARLAYALQQLINGDQPRHDLRPDRHRLHHGLRHHRHDQLRPWRHLHGRRLHRADRRSCMLVSGGIMDGPAAILLVLLIVHGLHRALWLDGRAHRLPAAARLVPPGAADLGHRHVDRAAELRADRPGRAGQAARAAGRRAASTMHARRTASSCSSPTSRCSSSR